MAQWHNLKKACMPRWIVSGHRHRSEGFTFDRNIDTHYDIYYENT